MADEQEQFTKRLLSHIEDVSLDPLKSLDQSLIEQSELLTDQLSTPIRRDLALKLIDLIQKIEENPTPVTKLLGKVLEPYTYSEVLNLNPNIDFAAGLSLEAAPYNEPTINLLSKATRQSTDAERVASSTGVLLALIRLWLNTADARVADAADELIINLLSVDREPPEAFKDELSVRTTYVGAVWRRIFDDKDVYRTVSDSCSMQKRDGTQAKDPRQVSLAQGRLLGWLPKVAALKWAPLVDGRRQESDSEYNLDAASKSLLHFAAMNMVDKTDILMRMLLMQFFSALLAVGMKEETKRYILEFLTMS